MLAKLKRIQKKQEISRLFKARLCVYTESFNLKVGKGKPEFGSRLLVVVSKKLFKRANKRNRLKRRLMHIFEEIFLKDPGSYDFFLVVKNKELIKFSHTNLETELKNLHLKYLEEKVKFLKTQKVRQQKLEKDGS